MSDVNEINMYLDKYIVKRTNIYIFKLKYLLCY